MLTQFNYMVAWVIYLVSALGIYLLFWPLLRRIRPPFLNKLLRAILAVLLFTPTIHDRSLELMAPANLSLAFEILQGNHEAAVESGLLMVLALVVVLAMLLLETLLRRLLQPSRSK